MIIRQAITEPSTGRRLVREIKLSIEDLRSFKHNEPVSQGALIASCGDNVAIANPLDQISALLDTKRTYVPCGLKQSRFVKKWQGGNIQVLNAGPEGLDAKKGDPIAIMSDCDGSNLRFCLIENVNGNEISVVKTSDNPTFYAGSFVQNLKSSWRTYGLPGGELGVTAALSAPESIPFIATPEETSIVINITTPMNPGTIKVYDVYVRKERFSKIESHWLADASDINIHTNDVTVTTHGGGLEAGGGQIEPGNTYFITILTKDSLGWENVNESIVRFVESVRT